MCPIYYFAIFSSSSSSPLLFRVLQSANILLSYVNLCNFFFLASLSISLPPLPFPFPLVKEDSNHTSNGSEMVITLSNFFASIFADESCASVEPHDIWTEENFRWLTHYGK